MTVGELIAVLSEFDFDLPVFASRGYEGEPDAPEPYVDEFAKLVRL